MVFIKAFRLRWRLILIIAAVILGFNLLYSFAIQAVQYRAVEALSWAVANKVVVIDPGHGGPDSGGIGPSGVLEKDITLQIAKKLALQFSRAGSAVVLTREEDRDLSISGKSLSQRKREDLRNRVKLAESRNADIFLSIHTNSFGTKWTGAQTFYHIRSAESRRLAEYIQTEIIRLMANTKRKPLPLDTYIPRNLKMPAVIVEVGFLSNPEEEKLLADEFYQNKMAYAIYAGVVKYFAEKQQ
ncbi:MAG TPA: N-acetylmuramoyl-L-alanine amidase CwlD [Peptococcaceae bacterium]|nr:MAG: N-acetylmuramoyl-L-alanine amidase CwlD [Clostridia bacterium 41_269]HBT20928.1 N-acetylmuramoyl-L-alanine amidase CwlD [Peptococcaceae bacterium]